MPMIRRSLWPLLALVACSTSSPSTPSGPAPGPAPTTCGAGEKRCAGACATTTAPELGCADPACAPCALPHASAACAPDGTCAVAACEGGWGDCNGSAADGCELDVTRADASCGACGSACASGRVCRRSSCVDANVVAASDWLSTKGSGWCAEAYNQMLNLCGDVEFCFDARFMRPYPTGLAVDVGLVWEATTKHTNFVAFGGDCDGKAMHLFADPGLLYAGGFLTTGIQVAFAPGKHLLSFQVSPTGSALFVDGLKVASGSAPGVTPELLGSCGPGLVLGQRISYWWEAAQASSWGHHAPFFVQLREGIADADAYSVARATAAGPGTVFLFDETGVDGARWRASVGGLTAVAKNSLDGTPQLDAGASGPLPAWRPLGQCALK